MFELIFLGIVGLILISPILFLGWVIQKFSLLKGLIETQGEELAGLKKQILRLQTRLIHLDEQENLQGYQQGIPPQEKVSIRQTAARTAYMTPTLGDAGPAPVGRLRPEASLSADPISKPSEIAGVPPTAEQPVMPIIQETLPGAAKQEIPRAIPQPASDSFPAPSLASPAHHAPSPSSQDWEDLIGGNVMNKLGAILLIIGVMLFQTYSLAGAGPWVKLAAGAGLSILLLALGVISDQRAGGRMMATGLIGGGWAGLYATTFAAHGVDATKVIDSPEVAMVLLLVIAAGMIVHSLKFASEMTTGLAFIIAFIALFVGPVSSFTEIAAVILSISMLAISLNKSWDQMAVTGVMLSYGSMLLRFWMHTPPSGLPVMQRLMFVQGLLLIYWLTFEGIGMIFLRRHPYVGVDLIQGRPARFIFLMNAVAYLLVSLAMWPNQEQVSWSVLAGMFTIQYVLDCLARGIWCANPGDAALDKARYLQGSAEDALALAALSLCVWMWYVLPAPVVAVVWGVTGLALIELAVRLPWQLLRFTGHFIMTLTFFRVFIANFPIEGNVAGISFRILTVVPLIALMFHLYLRSIEVIPFPQAGSGGTRAFAPTYLYFGGALAAFLLRFEFGPGLMAPLWGVLAALLAWLGKTWNNEHLNRQAAILAMGAVGSGFSSDLKNPGYSGMLGNSWIIGIGTALFLFAGQFLSPLSPLPTDSPKIPLLDTHARELFSLGGSCSLAYLLYLQVSEGFLTVSWVALGMSLLAAGFSLKERMLRLTGLGLALVCIGKIFLYDSRNLDTPLKILAFMGLGAALLGISWAYSRFREKFQELF